MLAERCVWMTIFTTFDQIVVINSHNSALPLPGVGKAPVHTVTKPLLVRGRRIVNLLRIHAVTLPVSKQKPRAVFIQEKSCLDPSGRIRYIAGTVRVGLFWWSLLPLSRPRWLAGKSASAKGISGTHYSVIETIWRKVNCIVILYPWSDRAAISQDFWCLK